jgi:hypothetical protein
VRWCDMWCIHSDMTKLTWYFTCFWQNNNHVCTDYRTIEEKRLDISELLVWKMSRSSNSSQRLRRNDW